MARARDALLALTAVAVLMDFLLVDDANSLSHGLRLGFTGICVAAMLMSLRRRQGTHQRAWYIISAGLALWFLADVVLDAFHGSHEQRPWLTQVGITDVIYLLAMILLIRGAFQLTTYRTALRDRTASLDALIVLLSLGSITLTYVLLPEYRAAAEIADMNWAAFAIGIVEPIVALLLASGAVRLWIGSGIRVTLSTRLTSIGLFLLAVADVFYWAKRIADVETDLPRDVGLPTIYLVAFGLIAAAVVDPSRTGGPSVLFGRTLEDTETRSRLHTVLVLSLALCAPTVAHEFAEVSGMPDYPIASHMYAAVTVLLAFLVGARFYYLLQDKQELSAELAMTVERERSLRNMQSILDNSSNAVFLVSDDGRIRYASTSVTELLGYPPEAVKGQEWTIYIDADDRSRASHLLSSAALDTVPAPMEIKFKGQDGTIKFVEVTARQVDFDGEVLRLVTHHDVTLSHQMQKHLEDQAFHDPLTGLANRALFREKMSDSLGRYRRQGTASTFHVMLIDLDDFKMVNDSLGHPAGDKLLRTVAARLRECLRENDVPARLGGDEFAVILTEDAEAAAIVAERILRAIQRPLTLGEKEIAIAASIGIAAVDESTYDSDDLSRNADLALYEAKNAGKGRWAMYEPTMHNEVVNRLNITNEMRHAIDRQEFEPWFQPIINITNDGLAGLECLARWHHPVRGTLPPDQFIAVAEDTGLIDDIGRTIFARAIELTDLWISRYPIHSDLRISVNISGRQLAGDDFVPFIAETLAATSVRPEQVVLEITESVLLPGEGIPVERLQELANLGISLYIDDFGTGWSSLRYLRNLPVHGIKLAQEFVNGLPEPSEVGMVRAVLDLATTLGLDEVVAEGIERDDQRRALRTLGYTLAQGYLLQRPIPAEEVEDLLAARHSAAWEPRANAYGVSRSASMGA